MTTSLTARLIVRILAIAMLAAPSVLFAQASTLTGVWDVSLETPQGAQSIEATLKQDGEAVTGNISSPLGVVNLKGKMVGDTLNIAYSLEVQGNSLDITMTGKLAGDAMAGTVSISGLGEVPWKAKRKAGAAASSAPAAAAALPGGTSATGKWNIALKMPQGEFPVSAAFTQDGEKVTGTISLPTNPAGTIPVTGKMIGSAIALEFNVETPQGDMPVTMKGDLGPAGFAGKASLGPLGEADWTGTRVQ